MKDNETDGKEKALQPGAFTDANIAILTSTKNLLTALAGGGQPNATPITAAVTRFSVCASGGDSALLPPVASVLGQMFAVENSGAQSMNVFPSVGDAINAVAVNGAFAIGAGGRAVFFAVGNGLWFSILSA